jgi:hypothetical protein
LTVRLPPRYPQNPGAIVEQDQIHRAVNLNVCFAHYARRFDGSERAAGELAHLSVLRAIARRHRRADVVVEPLAQRAISLLNRAVRAAVRLVGP